MKADLQKFIERRKRTDPKFAKDFESGFQEFKIGVLLRQAREQAGVTQEVLARRTKTKNPPFRAWRIMRKMCGFLPSNVSLKL